MAPSPKRTPRLAQASPEPRVTLRTLADHLGLSPASVSLVLNRAPAAKAIPPATQDRIRGAAAAFQYEPNTLARSLRRQRTFTVGVMVPEISEGYAALVISGIEDALLQAGYLYFVASHRHRDDLIDQYRTRLLSRAVDGLITVDTPPRAPLPVPVVAVSGHDTTPGVTSIVIDHGHAAALALSHLRGLGHRRLAFIKGQRFSVDTAIRWRTIRDAARALDLAIDPALVGQLVGDSPLPDLGYQVTRRLLTPQPTFTALFAFNDISALGAIRAIRDAGLRVPDDVSVVGFDDIPSAAYQDPGLTTVRQPLREMGQRAAETLIARIEQRETLPSRTIALAPSLMVRGTTGPARQDAGNRRSTAGRQRVTSGRSPEAGGLR